MQGGTIGVLGGMGPAATHRFFGLLVDRTEATQDQDHCRVVVDSNPHIPDRTRFLTGEGEDPRPALAATARNVERAGADFLTIPCNSAHAFFDHIREAVDIPVLHMIEGAIRELTSRPSVRRVGVLTTDGTRESRLYERAAAGAGIEFVYPTAADQATVMEAIYGPSGIKAGYREEPRAQLTAIVDRFEAVDALVAACTEVSLTLSDGDVSLPLIDPMKILADDAIRRANGRNE